MYGLGQMYESNASQNLKVENNLPQINYKTQSYQVVHVHVC